MLSLPRLLGYLSSVETFLWSPGLGVGVGGRRISPTPQPGLAWGNGAGNRGRTFTVYREPAVLEKPHLHTDPMWPCPGMAGWMAAPGGQVAWQLVWGLERSRGKVSIMAFSSGPPVHPGSSI